MEPEKKLFEMGMRIADNLGGLETDWNVKSYIAHEGSFYVEHSIFESRDKNQTGREIVNIDYERVQINHGGIQVFTAYFFDDGKYEVDYKPGKWENLLDELYDRALGVREEKFDEIAQQRFDARARKLRNDMLVSKLALI